MSEQPGCPQLLESGKVDLQTAGTGNNSISDAHASGSHESNLHLSEMAASTVLVRASLSANSSKSDGSFD
jgi:hypothetical protein